MINGYIIWLKKKQRDGWCKANPIKVFQLITQLKIRTTMERKSGKSIKLVFLWILSRTLARKKHFALVKVWSVSAQFNRGDKIFSRLPTWPRGTQRESKRERDGVGVYQNGLCGSWGAGNEDGPLASLLQSTTTLHGLSAQLTAGCTHTQNSQSLIKIYWLEKGQSGTGSLTYKHSDTTDKQTILCRHINVVVIKVITSVRTNDFDIQSSIKDWTL